MPRPTGPQPWSLATTRALYGPDGFFVRAGGGGPSAHFRTSVHASSLFAGAVLRLLREVDEALGRPAVLDLVDVGAGRGELLVEVASLAAGDPVLGDRLRLRAVELAPRPVRLPASIGWQSELPADDVVGLVVANEWLDDVPLDVVERGADGVVRTVLVDPATGAETPGPEASAADEEWLSSWWPLDDAAPGDRAEVGRPRDVAWAAAVRSLRRGVAVAVDYGHLREDRVAGAYRGGTLTGYRAGRAVPPVPDGSGDVTAHVAVDACLAAGATAGAAAGAAGDTGLLAQRDALRRLGLTGRPPTPELARSDPPAYAAALQEASDEAELLDPRGLGAFWWLAQSVGCALPASLR